MTEPIRKRPDYEQWRAIRIRLANEQRALAAALAAHARGEHVDLSEVSIKQSEVRALSALSKALMRKSFAPRAGTRGGPKPSA
jgi:hypothetical protein